MKTKEHQEVERMAISCTRRDYTLPHFCNKTSLCLVCRVCA